MHYAILSHPHIVTIVSEDESQGLAVVLDHKVCRGPEEVVLQEHHRSYKLIPSIGLAMLYPVDFQNVSIFCGYFILLGWVAMAPDYINLYS